MLFIDLNLNHIQNNIKPKFLKVLFITDGDVGENTFFIYVSVGGKIVVFKRHYD
jgi:hypothetical protein